eukprot:g1473.t1
MTDRIVRIMQREAFSSERVVKDMCKVEHVLELQRQFRMIEPIVKVRILLTLTLVPFSASEAVRTQFRKFIASCRGESETKWVQIIADIVLRWTCIGEREEVDGVSRAKTDIANLIEEIRKRCGGELGTILNVDKWSTDARFQDKGKLLSKLRSSRSVDMSGFDFHGDAHFGVNPAACGAFRSDRETFRKRPFKKQEATVLPVKRARKSKHSGKKKRVKKRKTKSRKPPPPSRAAPALASVAAEQGTSTVSKLPQPVKKRKTTMLFHGRTKTTAKKESNRTSRNFFDSGRTKKRKRTSKAKPKLKVQKAVRSSDAGGGVPHKTHSRSGKATTPVGAAAFRGNQNRATYPQNGYSGKGDNLLKLDDKQEILDFRQPGSTSKNPKPAKGPVRKILLHREFELNAAGHKVKKVTYHCKLDYASRQWAVTKKSKNVSASQ